MWGGFPVKLVSVLWSRCGWAVRCRRGNVHEEGGVALARGPVDEVDCVLLEPVSEVVERVVVSVLLCLAVVRHDVVVVHAGEEERRQWSQLVTAKS